MTGRTTNHSTSADQTPENDSTSVDNLLPHTRTLRGDRRDAVVAAAARVFEARGLEGASMRLIAREAGCTTGAIYPTFGGKEALYAEVLAQSLAALHGAIVDAIRQAPATRRGRAALHAFYEYYRAHPLELSLGLYLYQGARPVGLTRELDRTLNRALQAVFQVISEAIATSGHDEPATRATAGVAHAVGLLILDQTERLKLLGTDADEQMAFYLDAFVGFPSPPPR